MSKIKSLLFFSVFLSSLLLVNWHYDFDFTTGTPLNIRAFVFNMFFAREINLDHFWDSSGVTDLSYSPNGHLYSGYPPGAAFLTLPFFVVEQVSAFLHVHLLGPMNGTIAWWLESIFIALPSALALALTTVLLFDLLRRFGVGRGAALVSAWALPFTTFILPYATVIHYQPLAMFWVFLSLWLVLGLQGPALQKRKGRAFLGGFALGMATLTEYVSLLYVIPIGIYLFWRLRKFWPFAAGLAIPLAFLAFYNWQSFGAPYHFSHQYMGTMPINLTEYVAQPPEVRLGLAKRLIPKTLVFGLTPWVSLFGLYLSPLRGLIFHAPLVLLAPLGVIRFWKKYRAEALALIGGIAIITFLYSFWKEWWAGWNYGPRFLISTLPIWFLFVGFGLERLRFSIFCFLSSILLLFSNSAALTGLRDIVRAGETAAPWRLVPLERLQKFIGAITTLDNSKLSPFIFRFQSELPLLSSLSPHILYTVYLILLLTVELSPLYLVLRRKD